MFSPAISLSRVRMLLFLSLISFYVYAGNVGTGHLLWSYRPISGYVDATPAVADLDGDGVDDLVMATTGGSVVALDARGHIKWQYETHHIISMPVAVGGTPLKVFVLTNVGGVVCLDARRGDKLWEYTMPEGFLWGTTAPVVADLEGDGHAVVIVADRGGHLAALRQDGSLLWKTSFREGFRTAPAVADLDGDGKQEILAGAEQTALVCFSCKGKKLWESSGHAAGSSPLVTDINGDGRPEILYGDKEGLTVAGNDGSRRWHYPMKEKVHDAIVTGDLDGDGKSEVVVVDLRGNIACLSNDGRPLWTARVAARARRSPTLGDIDGDGETEVLVGSYADHLSIFDAEGTLKEEVLLHGGMNSAPLLADFRHNGRPVVVCATTSDVVTLSMLGGKEKKGTILSGDYRCNAARTGTVIHTQITSLTNLKEIDYGTLHTGINHFTVTVANPLRKQLTLTLTVEKEREGKITTTTVSADTLFRGSLTYAVAGDAPLTLTFTYHLTERGKLLAQRQRTFYLVPFVKDLDDLGHLLGEVRQDLPKLKAQGYALQQMKYLEEEYRQMKEESRLAGVMNPLERAALRTRYETVWKSARRLQALTAAAADAGSRLALYAANPWAPFGGVDEIVEGRTAEPLLHVEAVNGETESAAFNIINYSDRSVTVRVEPAALVNSDSSVTVSFRKVLSFHEVVAVPTHSLDLSADALPRMGQGRTLVVPPWSMRQVWINVDAAQLPAGDWSTQIRCRTLEVEPAEAVTTLNIKVWPLALTKEDPLRLCQWGYVESSVLKDLPQEALRDQVQHGTNVFVDGAFIPKASFDENGTLTGEIDFSAHDKYVREHAPYGLILFGGYQSRLTGPAKMFSPEWTKAYKEWIRRWRDHLKELGLGYDDYAFYPIDEPGLREGLVEMVVNLARSIKEVDPRLMVYADPVGRASMDDLKKMAPYLDIWCPNRNGYLLHEGNDKLEYIKSTGKTVWTYECEGDAKHQSPLGYYRGQSWLVWWRGLTGIGFWSYCTSRHDPWYVPRGGQDYLLIYQGDGVVTSKRWEAVRDGKEDYNLLVQLQQAVNDPPPGVSPEVLKEASRFLKEKTAVIAAYCGLDKDGTLPSADGMAATRKIEDRRWKTLQQTRRELAALLVKMKGER